MYMSAPDSGIAVNPKHSVQQLGAACLKRRSGRACMYMTASDGNMWNPNPPSKVVRKGMPLGRECARLHVHDGLRHGEQRVQEGVARLVGELNQLAPVRAAQLRPAQHARAVLRALHIPKAVHLPRRARVGTPRARHREEALAVPPEAPAPLGPPCWQARPSRCLQPPDARARHFAKPEGAATCNTSKQRRMLHAWRRWPSAFHDQADQP